MIEWLLILASSVALILFVAFIATRLLRSRRAGLSIRMQIFLALAGIVGAFALGLGVLVVDRVKARATLLAEESAQSEAAAIAALVESEMAVKGKSLPEIAHDFGSMDEAVRMTLLDRDGNPVGPRQAPLADQGKGVVIVSAPLHANGVVVGAVRVEKPTIVVERMLADFAPSILVVSFVMGAAAAIAAAMIGKTIASPIENLTDFAVQVSEGDRRTAAPVAQGREVQRLTRALDSMRRELDGRPFVETFAADLSHELKNPVAAIRASAEVLADGALDEPEEAKRFVARIQESTSRIEALLGELLSLARLEARGVDNATVVDLGAVVKEVTTRLREHGAEIELLADDAPVKGDTLWLTRSIENLVENAVVHGEPGAPIHVRLTPGDDVQTLQVTSKGAIGAHVRSRLFKRFVTTRADRGGTGLGLAIVRAVAEAHQGTIRCVAHGPPEVTFELKLPAA